MKRIFRVRDANGEQYDVRGIEILPGLAVCEVPYIANDGLCYSLTHLRSGLAVEFFDDAEHAGWCANQFLSGFDWTRSGEDIRSDGAVKAAYKDVRASIQEPYRHNHYTGSDYSDVAS